MKILLLGYMASGKSVIGKRLAAKLQVSFFDLDTYIQQKEKKAISEIFKDEGEIYFRMKEHEYLKELLSEEGDYVLSLGGGTPCYANNMEYILKNDNTISIYLYVTIKELVSRLSKNKSKRPLITQLPENKLSEFVAKHLFERKFYYEKANYKLIVNYKSIQDLVTELQILLY